MIDVKEKIYIIILVIFLILSISFIVYSMKVSRILECYNDVVNEKVKIIHNFRYDLKSWKNVCDDINNNYDSNDAFIIVNSSNGIFELIKCSFKNLDKPILLVPKEKINMDRCIEFVQKYNINNIMKIIKGRIICNDIDIGSIEPLDINKDIVKNMMKKENKGMIYTPIKENIRIKFILGYPGMTESDIENVSDCHGIIISKRIPDNDKLNNILFEKTQKDNIIIISDTKENVKNNNIIYVEGNIYHCFALMLITLSKSKSIEEAMISLRKEN